VLHKRSVLVFLVMIQGSCCVGSAGRGSRPDAANARQRAQLFPDQFAGLGEDSYLARKLRAIREGERLRPFREAVEKRGPGPPFAVFVHAHMSWTPESDPYRATEAPTSAADAEDVLAVFVVAVWKDGETLTVLHNVPDEAAVPHKVPGDGAEGPGFDFGPVLPLAVPRTVVRLCRSGKGRNMGDDRSCCSGLAPGGGDKVYPTWLTWDGYDIGLVHRRDRTRSETRAGINCDTNDVPEVEDFQIIARAILSCLAPDARGVRPVE
jgi:hypothetical protein